MRLIGRVVFFVDLVVVGGCGGGLEFKDPAVGAPLIRLHVTLEHGRVDEIFATLAPGIRMEDTIRLGLFDGFDPHMTLEAARQRLGPPTGEWDDPFCRRPTPFYQRSGGKVSLCRYWTESGAYRWDVVAHPAPCQPEHLFRDARVLPQIAPWLPAGKAISVHVRGETNRGSLTMLTTSATCTWVVLFERD